MCPNLSNLNYNNGSDVNAPNVVTDLSNISNQGRYGGDQLRFEPIPITEISNSSSNNSNGDVINETTSSTSPGEGPLRHSSMDRLMSLLNDMGQSPRTRSLSDGGQEEGDFTVFQP